MVNLQTPKSNISRTVCSGAFTDLSDTIQSFKKKESPPMMCLHSSDTSDNLMLKFKLIAISAMVIGSNTHEKQRETPRFVEVLKIFEEVMFVLSLERRV